jgi:stage II sporulation protein D
MKAFLCTPWEKGYDNMKKEKCKIVASMLLLGALLPLLITIFMQPEGTFSFLGTASSDSKDELVYRLSAQQIDASSNLQAICAQTVIARTMLRSGKVSEKDCPSEAQIRELWGEENYAEYKQKFYQAVEETKGYVLTKDGCYIDAAFHAVCAGQTRDAQEVYGENGPDYLKSVASKSDLTATDYLTVMRYSREELYQKLQALTPDETQVTAENIYEQIQIVSTDSAGYVTEIQIGDTHYTGEEFRSCLGLPSACFELALCEGEIRITVKGLGHGFGLSQFGANELALEGMGWQEILNYYYYGVNIVKENSSY